MKASRTVSKTGALPRNSEDALNAPSLQDLSVGEEHQQRLLRSRVFGSISVTMPPGVTAHRGLLRIVSAHLQGRNPMAGIERGCVHVEFTLDSRAPNNAGTVRSFATGLANLMGPDAEVQRAQVMQFDTSAVDDLLLPEHRSEEW